MRYTLKKNNKNWSISKKILTDSRTWLSLSFLLGSGEMKKIYLIGIPYQIMIGKKFEGDLIEFKETGKNSENFKIDKIAEIINSRKNTGSWLWLFPKGENQSKQWRHKLAVYNIP